jgi:ankyrin repeat protein
MGVPQSSNKKRKENKEKVSSNQQFTGNVSSNQQLLADVWLDAARDGNLAIIQHYLDSGWDVQNLAKSSYMALYLAVKNGHIEIVKLLLEHGADLNTKAVLLILYK